MNERRVNIIGILEKNGFASVSLLAEALGVSDMTIRRDLDYLEEKKKVRRVHGGAVTVENCNREPAFEQRATNLVEEKRNIARLAATLVETETTIALDSGSTALELVKCLVDIPQLTIVTSSIHIMNLCLSHPNIQILVPPGHLRPHEGSIVGSETVEFLRTIHVDQFFMGVGGIDSKAGVTEYNMDDIAVKKALAANAKQLIVLADASKFNKITFAKICDLDLIDCLVTNATLPKNLQELFDDLGTMVLKP
ncbi:DeoR/GlpR family DNA-binding transcription regulator [Sphaerochaeta globosa]|uniref:Transcriptional regulator, DeoR family n=1 Tax=Sphaerochaeta globosa (strain ATCC BAA-1886 / DSM 22777 / Buddy) TaxID=158189 RepID=F0RRJ5_SPHGB|nr:DeoR/GlpR family DNA-binding transcription regulator [Sphaerochaeta globosa]ADY14247.1 transcriptional regulator, DeoR family [Sphaerochaeta globosa str. Buddy]